MYSCAKVNELTKVFLHLGNKDDKLVVYFKENPEFKILSKKNNTQKTQTQEVFSLTNIGQLSSETKDNINKINLNKHPFYKIKILENIKNDNSINFQITYNTEFVSEIKPFIFNAISSFKGLTFNILHKEIIRLNEVKKPIIVLDLGHGGNDTGAVGKDNVAEKNITYAIGIKLKKLLDKKGFNVYLTRDSDKFIALDQRTTFANLLPATIFISIHANFSKNRNASGIETYYADNNLLTSVGNGPIEKSDNLRSSQNKLLADVLHKELMNTVMKNNSNIVDRKVKKSISQVLLGAEMPAVLIEVGFVSNDEECKLLNSDEHQQIISQGVYNGICLYFNSLGNF